MTDCEEALRDRPRSAAERIRDQLLQAEIREVPGNENDQLARAELICNRYTNWRARNLVPDNGGSSPSLDTSSDDESTVAVERGVASQVVVNTVDWTRFTCVPQLKLPMICWPVDKLRGSGSHATNRPPRMLTSLT